MICSRVMDVVTVLTKSVEKRKQKQSTPIAKPRSKRLLSSKACSPTNWPRAQCKAQMYRSKAGASWRPLYLTQPMEPSSPSGAACPMPYHAQAMRCATPNMRTMALMMLSSTCTVSERVCSRTKRSTCEPRASRRSRVARSSREKRPAVLWLSSSRSQSELVQKRSSGSHVRRYCFATTDDRISTRPCGSRKPVQKVLGMWAVQKSRTTQDMKPVYHVSDMPKTYRGTMITS
mmetsp:Transcript_60794/g.195874  ORF Transcript_60794/g.195874 Transcript_60794/m.195874 type:complete len:232 (-) Transcript_60794:283-978(-)